MPTPLKKATIAYNSVVAKLINPSEEVRFIASEAVSYVVEGYEHSNAYKMGGWDGRSSFYNWHGDTFPAGLVRIVEAACRDKGYNVALASKKLPEPLGPEWPEIDSFGFVERYDYQINTVRQLEKRGMMIARVATGGGKSRIARLATARLNRPTLFLTTRQALLYQMQEGYEESGMKCGVVGDGRWEPDPMINVGMIQTIASRLEEPAESDESSAAIRQRRIRQQTLDWLANFEFVIGEEAHEASGDSYFTVLNACKNARYRLALTATPFMKSDSEANMRLHAAFGPIGIQISEKLLIDRGILAKPIFKYVDIGAPSKLRAGSNYHRAVELGIVDNDERNEHAVKEALHASEYGLPVLVLIQRKQHGKKIEEMMKAAGLKAEFIFGESSKKKRDAAMERVKNGETQVLIGSTILDVGVDCPVMGMLILLGGGKAEVSLRQRIGRVLREKKLFPNYAFIVDFKDRNNKHILSHAVQRRHVVENTPGFAENILPAGQDFDFEGLGFERLTLTV